MKKYLILILLVVLLSIFSISIFAQESFSITLIDNDGSEYVYYGTSQNWSAFIHEQSGAEYLDFEISGDIVFWRGKVIKSHNGVLVRGSSIFDYNRFYVYDPIDIDGSDIIFNYLVDDISFKVIYDGSYSSFTYSGTTKYVYYNGYHVMCGDNYLKLDDIVYSSLSYHISDIECQHYWEFTRNIIQTPNCLRPLIQEQECIHCHLTREFTDDSSIGEDHDYTIEISYVKPTCLDTGYRKAECENCGDILEEILEPLNHIYSKATCISESKCKRCGIVNAEALGHDLNRLGFCKREGCNYSTLRENLDNIGTNIKDAFKNDDNPLSDFLEGTQQNIKDSFDRLLTAVFGFLLILIVILILKRYK